MLVVLLAVGRIKKGSYREACEEYERRLRRYAKFEVREVRDAGRKDRDAATARRVEGEALLAAIPRGSTVVVMSRSGVECDSPGLAARIEGWQHQGRDLTFIIGGAHGLDQPVIDSSTLSLRLSAMTLPHELARLTLLEQRRA